MFFFFLCYIIKMNSETIVYCVVALILGMLMAHLLKGVCGCKVVEGNVDPDMTCRPEVWGQQGDQGLAYRSTTHKNRCEKLNDYNWHNGAVSTAGPNHGGNSGCTWDEDTMTCSGPGQQQNEEYCEIDCDTWYSVDQACGYATQRAENTGGFSAGKATGFLALDNSAGHKRIPWNTCKSDGGCLEPGQGSCLSPPPPRSSI
jgi:hypothetical protein